MAAVYCAARVPSINARRAVSSAVEHYLDMVGVTSSILVPPTKLIHPAMSFATWAVHEEKKGRPRAAFFLPFRRSPFLAVSSPSRVFARSRFTRWDEMPAPRVSGIFVPERPGIVGVRVRNAGAGKAQIQLADSP
jgi:hypothetical protein